ncbi:MAG TPA: TonB-dependent receptor [Allosphingosinicella sp.]|jgi:hypothetical protein
MRVTGSFIAGLLAASAPAGLQAQEVDKPSAPPPPETAEEEARPEITDRDGNPLPPKIQREIREHLKKNPLPAAPKKEAGSGDGKDIVVRGQRPRGSVIGDIPPTQTLNPIDIRALGATDIGSLLETLGPQVSSGRGRGDSGPIVLLNGKRTSGFAEIARIPTEAIERMEVFPEELALKYGYRADQKVVNIVTRERFTSRVGQLSYAMPTEGGRDTTGVNANFLNISRDTRINLNADYSQSGALLESERKIARPAGTPDSGRFRTLLPESERVALNATVSGEWLSGVSATLNGRFEAGETTSLLGPGLDGPLVRDIDTRLAHLGTALSGRAGTWGWAFDATYDRNSVANSTDTSAGPGARDHARSVNAVARADLVLNGTLLELPSGPITTSVRVGGETRDFNSRSLRAGAEQRTELARDTLGVQANLDVPIARRSKGQLAWLGDLSANANLALDELSDFGTLRTFGYGLTWSPLASVNVIAAATDEEGAPTVEQLGAPLVVTPNVRTYDFSRREVVDITRAFGGNPVLRADDREVFKLGLNVRPLSKTDLTFGLDYIKTRINDPIAAFPIATPEFEAAFPERFTRDAEGRLLRIDSRPLNFQRSEQQQLRFGINFSRPLGPVPAYMKSTKTVFAGSEEEIKRKLPPGAILMKGEPGSAMAKQAENLTSRLTLSLHYTATLVDEILTREGGPVLDLLNGSATDVRGGRARHAIDFQAGVFKGGLGARVKVGWQSGTTLSGLAAPSAPGSGDLTFANRATVNINLFANLAEYFKGPKAPDWMKGMRVSFGITNLFNSRPDVRDEAGLTPFSYQPAYLDPLGRTVSFSLRKVF